MSVLGGCCNCRGHGVAKRALMMSSGPFPSRPARTAANTPSSIPNRLSSRRFLVLPTGEKLPVVFDSIAPVLLSQKGSLFLTRPFLFHHMKRRDALEASANELFEVVGSGKVHERQSALCAQGCCRRPQGVGSARHLGLHRPDHLTQYSQEFAMSKTAITSPEIAPPALQSALLTAGPSTA